MAVPEWGVLAMLGDGLTEWRVHYSESSESGVHWRQIEAAKWIEDRPTAAEES